MLIDETAYKGMPPENNLEPVLLEQYFQAIDNMQKVFAIRPDDKLLFLSDHLIDQRVFHASLELPRAAASGPSSTSPPTGTAASFQRS